MKRITLLTDFGSFYPAQMNGAILSKVKDATFVDMAHDIPPQDVRAGGLCSPFHGEILSLGNHPLGGGESRGRYGPRRAHRRERRSYHGGTR